MRFFAGLAGLLLFAFAPRAQDVEPQDAGLSTYRYPYPVKFYTVHVQGQKLRMAFMDVKPVKANGKTIMLLHGKNFNGAYWDSTAAALAASDVIFTQPVVYEFENIKMPILLIIGQWNRTALGKANAPEEVRGKLGNYPELGRSTAGKIPQSKLVELVGVGHLPHIEAFQRVIDPLIAFLR